MLSNKINYNESQSLSNSNKLIEKYKELILIDTSETQETHLFNLKNQIFRNIQTNLNKIEDYKELPFIDEIEKAGTRSCFHTLAPNKAGKIQNISDYHIDGNPRQNKSKQAIKIMTLCPENARNVAGGIGNVVLGLSHAYQEMAKTEKINENIITVSPMYKNDKINSKNLYFYGLLPHQFNGKIILSSIYKNKVSKEYLIEPDPAFCDLFNSSPTINSEEKHRYLESAGAAFAALYKGKTGDKSIDILKCDTWIGGGVAISLIEGLYSKLRNAKNLPPIKTVTVMHNGDLSMRTPISIKDAKDLGMPNFELYSNNRMCLHRIAMQQADQVISVGNNLTQRALEDLELRNLLLSKVVTIQNGANLDQFDVTNKNTFKSNALKKTFDSNGIETTDYISYRKNLKERLYRQKLIASPTAPMVVFVGRFNPEKGIDILVETVKKSRDLDVQFVFIGWAGENYPPLLELKKMAEGSDKDRLRIFATKEEQKTPFEEIQTIQALRSAADLSLIPSHAEAIGLSAMEALVGTLLIAPEHQGFLDLCKSIDQFDLNTANSVCYKDHTNADQATKALKKGLQVWSNLSPQEKNQLIIRLRNTALKTFNWFYHPSDNEKPIGQFLLYSKMFQELVNKQKIDYYAPDIEKYFNKMKETQITKTDQFINNNFNLKELSMSELIKLHELVSGENLAFYLFNIENQIFRNILLNPNELKDYLSLIKSPSLKIKIDQLKEKISEPSFLEIKELPLPINNSDRPTKILTVALEKTAHCESKNHESKSEKDFYLLPLFAKDKQQNINLKIHGIISHQYNGIEVQSTIYKNKETSEYLIEPDPFFSNLFNIPLNKSAYDTTNHYDLYDRISYLGSATAAFIATYQGKKKNKRIDVIKSEEALIGGISFPLLKDKYRATFVKKITQWHPEVDLGTKILVSRNRLINLGFNHQNLRSPAYDILGISTDAADEVIYPNEQMREEAKTHPNHRPDFDAPD